MVGNASIFSTKEVCFGADLSAYCMMAAGVGTLVFAIYTGMLGAGYGRHYKEGNKGDLSDIGYLFSFKVGWIIQETGSILGTIAGAVLAYVLLRSENGAFTLYNGWVFLVPFWVHYIHRTYIYPFFTLSVAPLSCGIVMSALSFCLWNGATQAVSSVACNYGAGETPNYYVGVPIFVIGMAINMHADYTLIGLKKQNRGYQIPQGGLFNFITSPNYFGETLEWIGYMVYCNFSMASIAFVVFTAGNLVPRAMKHHKWYQEKFQEYPSNRKIFIPFIF